MGLIGKVEQTKPKPKPKPSRQRRDIDVDIDIDIASMMMLPGLSPRSHTTTCANTTSTSSKCVLKETKNERQ